MTQCSKNFEKIQTEVTKMYQALDPKYFFFELRPLVQGF